MKIVADTNVFISGIFFSGNPDRILRAIRNKQFDAYCSSDIVSEYHTVFYRMLSKASAKSSMVRKKSLLMAHSRT